MWASGEEMAANKQQGGCRLRGVCDQGPAGLAPDGSRPCPSPGEAASLPPRIEAGLTNGAKREPRMSPVVDHKRIEAGLTDGAKREPRMSPVVDHKRIEAGLTDGAKREPRMSPVVDHKIERGTGGARARRQQAPSVPGGGG
jgi:hypothetical protein